MIKIQNLTKKYGDLLALDNINLEIDGGEIVGLLGPNGAGKSTMMNILTGFIASTDGTVSVDEYEISENPTEVKKKIGYLPEIPPLYVDMTVNEYLNFVYDLKDCKIERKGHLNEIMSTVKITDVGNRLIANLSKGYKQRVGIAAALIGNPELIIFDEPTVGLDPKQIIEVRSLLRSLGKKHTIILSTHIMSEVEAICDRIVIINNGKIVADEKADKIALAVKTNRKIKASICGNQNDVIKAIKNISGVVNVVATDKKDTDATVYTIESENLVDIRKALFSEMAKKNFYIIGLENEGMNLEEVFIAAVDGKESKSVKAKADRRSFAKEIMNNIKNK